MGTLVRTAIRAEDLAARCGGDEFAIFFHDADPEAAALCATGLAARLRGARHGDACLKGASIGLVCLSVPPADADTLFALADAAMYEAKRRGTAGVVVRHDLEPSRPTAGVH